MAITIREKEEWRDMLTNKINSKVKLLWAANPALEKRLRKLARTQAIEALGIEEYTSELKDMESELTAKLSECHEKFKELAEELGIKLNDRYSKDDPKFKNVFSNCRSAIETAIISHSEAFYQKLLAEDVVGAEIVALQSEIPNVQQAVWLASSPAALKALWNDFVTSLNLPVSDMERRAADSPV